MLVIYKQTHQSFQEFSNNLIICRGGYIIRPRSVEFWQGQRDRLHDRIKFRKPKDGEVADGKLLHEGEDGWVYERLSP